MDVSIIIINYNTFKITCDAIRSVYRFTTDITFEVILVDNGSTECDAALFKKKFPDIVLLKSSNNIGFSKGNNLGIKEAKAPFILLLNSDVVLIENSVKKCADILASLPENTVALSCRLILPDGRVQHPCSRFPNIINEFMEATRIHKLLSPEKRSKQYLRSYFNHAEDIYPDWIWGTFFMLKKETLSLLPGNKLNEDYFMYDEDMRWCYDFKKAGKQVYYFAGTTVVHHTGRSSTHQTLKENSIIQNELDFIAKTKGKAYMLVYVIINGLNKRLSGTKNYKNTGYYIFSIKTALLILFGRATGVKATNPRVGH